MIINRKCPFCRKIGFKVEKQGTYQNLYKLICNRTVKRMYVEQTVGGRFRQVSVNPHPPSRKEKYGDMTAFGKSQYDKLQTPFWKLMGQKPKAKDIEYEKMLKWKGMTYGDAVMERSQGGQYQNAMPELEKHL